ncbi:NAD(P)/FAD-dependent oxidoreductase [Sphingopyxis fribergensis]
MKQIVIVGGGFAGLWSAVSAARRLEELGQTAQITLVNLDQYHSIRVRNYEADLSDTLIELSEILDPIGVNLLVGRVTGIDTKDRRLVIEQDGGPLVLDYDKLILASGSKLTWPAVPGLIGHAFNVDTYAAARRLQHHIEGLGDLASTSGRYTALVIGSGATGVEVAAELPARLAAVAPQGASVRVILADRSSCIAPGLGGCGPVIERAYHALGVETLTDVAIRQVDACGVVLADGSRIEASTVIWCGGMQADELTSQIEALRDRAGRLHVDAFMKVPTIPDIFVAGDAAHALIDGERPSVMSCQHARPMGRYAGANAVNALFGQPLVPLHIDWYTNIVDLGPWGAVYSQGWNREVVAVGAEAKQTKTIINRVRIYPPREGGRDAILAAGSIALERPPVLTPLEFTPIAGESAKAA